MSDPGTKYADKVQPQHRMAMDSIVFAYMAIEGNLAAIKEMVEAEARSHSYLHITNPTLYRDTINSKQYAQNIRLCKAALAFAKEAEAIIAETVPETVPRG